MEATRKKLSSMIAAKRGQDRDLQDDQMDTEQFRATARATYDPIDSSPIMSPENIRDARARLSRLVLNKKAKIANEDEEFYPRQQSLARSMKLETPQSKKSSFRDESNFSPTRSHRRVTLEPRAYRPEDEPPKRNHRLGGRVLTRARSYSPLPSRSRLHAPMYQTQYPQHEPHDMDLPEHSDVGLASDLNKIMVEFQALNIKLTVQLDRVSAAYDSRSLHNELDSAAHILREAGIAKVQLWTRDTGEPDSDAYSTYHSGSEHTLNPHLSKHLTYTHDHMQSMGTAGSTLVANPSGVSTWLPEHASFGSLLSIAQHYGDMGKVEAVHGLSVTNRYNSTPNAPHFGRSLGVLLAIESSKDTASGALTEIAADLQHQNVRKLRRFLVQQMLQRIASAVEGRLSLIEAQREHQRLNELLNESEMLLQSKEDEIDQRDAVVAVKEAQLRAKDMKTHCHDALLTCATLLSESKLYHSAFIASAVARSGSVGDKHTPNTSYCWFLFRESENFEMRHLNDQAAVCAISGQVREGYSPVSAVSGQNKLITKLLHGDASGQSVARVATSKRELFEAGLPVSDAAGFELEPPGSPPRSPSRSGNSSSSAWKVLSFPLQIRLPDKLAYDCPGHCVTQAAIVIAVPQHEDIDLFASHATSLAHLAQTAFESLRAQYESNLRQNLLSISTALYDAVVTVRPAPVSEEYSPTKSRRNAVGAAVPAPVTFEPHYQRALNALCNTVNSAELAQKFGARKSVLLVSDIVAFSLKLIDAPAEARKLSFLTTTDHSLQSVSCPTIDLSVTSWLQELYQGNIVHYDSAITHGSAAMPDAFNVDSSLRGAVSKQRKQVSPSGWESHQLLRALVQAVDAHSTYCVLVPIRTAAGLSVLMLIDKLSEIAGVTNPGTGVHARSEVIPFASDYITAMLHSDVCAQLKNCLDILHQQCSAFWAERKLASEIEAQEETERKLCELVETVQAKALLTTQFAKWKLSSQHHSDQETLGKRQELFNAVLQLVSHRRIDESTDCRASFLNVLETQLKALFPYDSVKLIENSPVGVGTVHTKEEFAPLSLARDILNLEDSRVAKGTMTGSKQARNVVITVKLVRPVQLNRPFSASELNDFEAFCTHASDVYTALSRGFTNDLADGDIRSLVFPLLQQLLPALLGSADRAHASAGLAERSVLALLPLLVQWMKRACNADMVLLRLNPFAGVQNEALLSSEEVESTHIEGLRESLPLLGEFVHAQTAQSGVDTVTESSTDHIVLKFVDRSHDGEGAQLGEMKILSTSAKKQFSAEQRTVAQVVSYLLAYTVRNSARAAHIKSVDSQLRQEAAQMQQMIHASSQALTNESRSSEAFKSRLANILSTIMFTDKVASTGSLQDLAALISDGLPKLIGVSSAVLLVHEAPKSVPPPGPFGPTPALEAVFRVVLPRSNRPSDSLSTSAHSAMANSTMSTAQLRQVPVMFENESSTQCRIDLIAPDGETLFGSILLFRTPLPGLSASGRAAATESTATYELWHGLEDILRNALSSSIHQATTRIAAAEEIDALNRSLSKASARLQEQEHLEPDVANLLSIKRDLEDQRDALQTDVAGLKSTIDEILSEKKSKLLSLEGEIDALKARSDDTSAEFVEKIDALEQALMQEKDSAQQLDASKKQLLELVSSFSFDQRCEQETILFWLKDVAETTESSLHLVAQDEGGVLRGAEGIRGIMSAVGEAVRTGLTVEFTSALQSDSTRDRAGVAEEKSAPRKTLLAQAPTALRFSRSDGRSTDYTQTFKFDPSTIPSRTTATSTGKRAVSARAQEKGSHPEESGHVAVLCVPNRCAGAASTNEQACFVFVKSVNHADEKFSAEEKDLLNSAANLSSRTLVQCANKLSDRDFRLLEAELDEVQQREARLRQVIALGDVLRQRQYSSKSEVNHGVEIGVKDLLSRGQGDSCVVESALWLPPWAASVDGGGLLDRSVHSIGGNNTHNADIDALHRVLSTGQRLRRRSTCCIPLFNHHNDVIAILRVERRFAENSDATAEISSPSSVDSGDSPLPTIAHLVITDIEEDMLAHFAGFVVPLLERMDFIEEARDGVQQAGHAIVALQGVKATIEDKYALEVAHRLELEESLKSGAEMLGMTNSARVATEQLLDATRKSILSFTSSLDCFIIMPTAPAVSQATGAAVIDSTVEYCTFTADIPREVAVSFEQGDLEVVAMQNFRAIAAAGENMSHHAAQGLINLNNSRAWQSWAVRRIHTHANFGMDFETKHGDSEEPELFALAVPFALRSGAVAVVSVVRRAAPFSSTDRECITWVSKVLAYCLERKGGEEAMLETIQLVKSLQSEIARYQEIDSRLSNLEDDTHHLGHDLTMGRICPPLPKELLRKPDEEIEPLSAERLDADGLGAIVSATKAIFGGGSGVNTWSVEEVVAVLGNIISPSETSGALVLPPAFKTAARDVLINETGSVTCWLDAEGMSHKGLEYFRSLASAGASKDGNKSAPTRMNARAVASEQETVWEDAVLFLLVQLKGYPVTWVRVNAGERSSSNLQLRLSVLLQLLSTVEPWRNSAVSAHNALVETRRAQVEEKEKFDKELEHRAQLVEDIRATFANNLGGTKDKYKSIVTEKSGNYRKAEKIYTETLVAAQTVRAGVSGRNVSRKEVTRSVVEGLMHYSKVVQGITGLQVAVAQCATSAVRDSAVHVPAVPPLASGALPKTSSAATAASRTKKASPTSDVSPWSAQFAAENEAPLQWLTSQPSGLDSRRSLSGSAPVAQHAAIRVELFGGMAHTNPLQIALATNKIILFIPEGSGADAAMKESLLSIGRKLGGVHTAETNCVCLNPSEQYPLYSIILPIFLPGVDTTVLMVVRSTSTDPAEELSKYVLYSLFAGVLTLKQACLEVLQRQLQDQETAAKCKKLALTGMKRALTSTDTARATQALVFEKMRSARITAKLDAALSVQSQFSTVRAQTRLLEQANADWTEMVKGLNGASAGMSNGIAGLWAQACPTLMGLISSQVTLKGCGLLVPSDSRESHASDGIMEYTVRELSTPLSFPNRAGAAVTPGISKFSPPTDGEIADYARGALESRPASDLGSNVLSLVQDIFSGRTGNQHIFKLSRSKTGGDNQTSLWLVPIRTARSVLGVLRVSVEAPHSADVPPAKLEETLNEQSEVLEAAQSNVINFSEVLAPLYLAAQLLDKAKQKNTRLEDSAAQGTSQVKLMTQELSQTAKKCSLLAGAMQAVGTLGSVELNVPFTKPEDSLRIFCNRLALSLSEKLSGRVVVHIHRNIISPGVFEDEPAVEQPVVEPGSVSEALVDHAGKPFGRLIFTPNKDSTDTGEVTARKLYAGKSSQSNGAYVLHALAPVVSGLLLRSAREIGASARVSTASEKIRDLQDALRSEQEAVALCEQKNDEQILNNDFYRGLAEVINQCLMYCSTDQKERLKLPIDGETYYFSLCKGLQSTLSGLCVKLPTLVGQSCSFSFALLDSKSSHNGDLDGILPQERKRNNVTWVHAAADEAAGPLDWHTIGPNARDIVMNLAHTCIAKRTKSACDIGVNLEREGTNNANSSAFTVQKLTSVRVISYPLVDQNTSVVLGVVQCLLDPSAQRGEIDSLCEDIANCVSSLLSVEVQQQKLCGRTQVQKLDMLTAEVKHAETAQLKEIWQQRCRAWHALSLLAATVTKSSLGAEKFLDVLGSSVVASLLCDAGIRLSLRSGSVTDAHRQLMGSGGRNILASALLPVTDSGELVAEIVCDKASVDAVSGGGTVLPEHQGLTMIAADLVETTADIFRGAMAIHQSRHAEVQETAKLNAAVLEKASKLKHELRRTKEQLHTATTEHEKSTLELGKQTARIEKLRQNTTAAVNKLCTPVIAELSTQLETICNLLMASGLKEDSELLMELQMLSSRVSSPRSPRAGSVTGSPRGLRLDSPEGSTEEFSTVLQPVNDLVVGLRSVVQRVASMRVQERIDAQKRDLEQMHDSHLQKHLTSQERLHVQQQQVIQKQLSEHQAAALKLQQQSNDLVLQHQKQLGSSQQASARPTAAPVLSLQNPNSNPKQDELARQKELLEQTTAQVEHTLVQLSRARKVHRMVCREASALLDPPFVSNNARDKHNRDENTARVAHPASLTPLAASQDCCVKLLGMVRSLLRTEGQSLLLRDPGTEPVTYQVIYTGNSLHWAGIEQGTFGVVSSSANFIAADGTLRTSLAETAIHTRKTVMTPNAPMDPRYYAYIDGICDLGTPMLMVPVRGRGGSVVGVLIAARGKDAAPFTAEDIVAAEICSALGALSLYWCQGMGTLHHQLVTSTNKVAKLERMLDRVQENADAENE